MKVLITGSCGLVGSEAAEFYLNRNHSVLGIDNNLRKKFFGDNGDTGWMLRRLNGFGNYEHCNIDIRSPGIITAFRHFKPDLVIHCAGQPSHDWAASDPKEDFTVNAYGTLNLLCAMKDHAPWSTFVFMSTNKVYGDAPNSIPVKELDTRYEFKGDEFRNGIDESMSIDQSVHSLFGASKASADLIVQEYGKYFGLNTGVFRAGCITGRRHSGAEQHGFLSYIAKCKEYTVYGYIGKQLRDQIHSIDIVRAIDEFRKNPRQGEVYNMGGGKENTISVLEALYVMGVDYNYDPTPRVGDHRCYYSDTSKFRNCYPDWSIQYPLDKILDELKGE